MIYSLKLKNRYDRDEREGEGERGRGGEGREEETEGERDCVEKSDDISLILPARYVNVCIIDSKVISLAGSN